MVGQVCQEGPKCCAPVIATMNQFDNIALESQTTTRPMSPESSELQHIRSSWEYGSRGNAPQPGLHWKQNCWPTPQQGRMNCWSVEIGECSSWELSTSACARVTQSELLRSLCTHTHTLQTHCTHSKNIAHKRTCAPPLLFEFKVQLFNCSNRATLLLHTD
jgi:hypothetical protein